jgi:serine/threonine-protein kinase
VTAEQWEHVKSLFAAVLEQPVEKRHEFLLRESTDEVVRLEVERLVAGAEQVGSFLGDPGLGSPSGKNWTAESVGRSSEGRFPAGTFLCGRYRVLGLLGTGGMGEVYRVMDTTLGQVVALKFVSQSAAANEELRARFHEEVRLARQISHPNVCRVYDIGELQGVPYISMEYVDGEDLKSLLRRIGRLPGDKAIEISRRLCAGLAAAHDKGVLHRDLKPSNIMIDGRGQVLIMDFGLARQADDISGTEIRNGTPAYMAPEQMEGREVTVRSDLYSLGLVMYEMFSGKRAFADSRERVHPPSLFSTTKDIEPEVDRIVSRCLEPDPMGRPVSAVAVAAALPQGDALAEALAAGHTPSPGLVAAAAQKERLPVVTAMLCFGLTMGALFTAVLVTSKANDLAMPQVDNSPEVLAQRARDLLARIGYSERPTDRAYGFALLDDSPNDGVTVRQPAPAPRLYFWYRESPRFLETLNADGVVSLSDPPRVVPGMHELTTDKQGRLIALRSVFRPGDSTRASDRLISWDPLFDAAGLSPDQFVPVEPRWDPPVIFDAQKAWRGPQGVALAEQVRVEAASRKGRPVYFEVSSSLAQQSPDDLAQGQPTIAQFAPVIWQRIRAGLGTQLIIATLLLLTSAGILARRNYQRGRVDIRGSWRLAGFAFTVTLLEYLMGAHHLPLAFAESGMILRAISSALMIAAVYWVLYTAQEPYVRRRWPHSLITWTRLLSGRWGDPMVGAQILIGLVLGLAGRTLRATAQVMAPDSFAIRPALLTGLHGVISLCSIVLGALSRAVPVALALFFSFFLLRAICRKDWLAGLVQIFLIAAPIAHGSARPWVVAGFLGGLSAVLILVVTRYGVMPLAVALFVEGLLSNLPLTTNFSGWYAGATIFAVVLLALASIWSFRVALAGRSLLREEFLDH